MSYRMTLAAMFLATGLAAASGAASADVAQAELVLKDHKFVPAELTIPANQRVKLVVKNQDPTPAEFESGDFKAEKIVPANGEVSLFIGPLKPGRYTFYDEFHEDDTRGVLIVKEP